MEAFFSSEFASLLGFTADSAAVIKAIISFLALFLSFFGGSFFAKRRLRKAYEDEKNALREQVELLEKSKSGLEASNEDLLKQVPSGWLEISEKERRNGNEERAFKAVKGGFDHAAPYLSSCCTEIAENYVSRLPDDPANLLLAERYLKIARLLDPDNISAAALMDDVLTEKAALALEGGFSPEKLRELEEVEDYLEPDPGSSPEQTVLAFFGHIVSKIYAGQYSLALLLARRARIIAKRTLPESNAVRLAARYYFSGALQRLGRYDEALAEIDAVIPAQKQASGEHHPHTLFSRYQRAVILECLGRYDEALAEIDAVIPARKQASGEHHPDTLGSRYQRAFILGSLGRYDEALTEIDAVIPAQKQALGEHHPDTLVSRYQRAGILERLGRYDEALAEIDAVIPAQKQALGEHHPHTLFSRYQRAGILGRLGRYDEALAEIDAVIPAQKQALGEHHPDTLGSRHQRAVILGSLGRYDEALTEIDAVIPARKQALGEHHPRTLGSRYQRAVILERLGRYDEALAEIDAVIPAQKQALGEHHPHTLFSRGLREKIINNMGR